MKTYNFYATLFDAFQRYFDTAEIWDKYYTEKFTLEEYEAQAEKELLDKINRVPFVSEAADKGTAFNQLIDSIITETQQDNIKLVNKDYIVNVNRDYYFDAEICKDIAMNFIDCIPQYYTQKLLEGADYNVMLYGYIDMVAPFKLIDIKTTAKYESFKYRKNWQHKVYPFCMNNISDIFEYYVVEFASEIRVHREVYNYLPSYTADILEMIDKMILFIENHRNLITDKKIVND
jgi:hypothetical protein